MGWIRRLRTTLFDSAQADDVAEEIRFHLEQRAEDYLTGGADVDDARRRARRRFGSMAAAREEVRDADTLRWLADFLVDARYALRMLRKAPGFSAAAVLTLALATGVNVAIFSTAYGVLLKRLPYSEPERLVQLSERHAGAVSPLGHSVLSDLTFDAWRTGARTVERMGAYSERAYSVAGDGDAERVQAAAVSPEVFDLLRVAPAAGRFFGPDDAIESRSDVVVLSHAYWQRRFGGRSDVVGSILSLDGRTSTIVGVAPEGFSFPDRDRQLYTPFVRPRTAGAGAERQVRVFSVVARLAPGATATQASAEGTSIARALGPRPIAADMLFGKGGAVVVTARTLVAELTHGVRPILLLLSVSVTLLLLLGCANVASLCLSRGLTRESEIAMRAALGAGRGRLARQLGTESLVLAGTSAVLGVFIAWALIQAWPFVAPRSFPRTADVALSWGGVLYAAALSLAAGLFVGVAPAIQAFRVRAMAVVHAGASPGRPSRRTRQALLVVQSAVAVILLVGAVSLMRSFERIVSQDTGYEAAGVITARVSLEPGPERASNWPQVAAELAERAGGLPFVDAVAVASMAPLGSSTLLVGFRMAGNRPEPEIARALGYVVTPGYADTLRLRVREGRFLAASDATAAVQPMVVNEEFVRQYLMDGKPVLGRRYESVLKRDATTEIVGVVGSVLRTGFSGAPQAEFYVPLGNQGLVTTGREIYLVMRSNAGAATIASALRPIVREIDAAAPLHTVRALEDELAATAGEPRFAVVTLAAFAMLALGLAAIGLHGGLTYALSQRTRELAIRSALGASRRGLVALVVRDTVVVTASGLVLGLIGAAAGTRVIRGLLFGLDSLDGVSFLAAPALLVCAALVPCAVAAWRITRFAPSAALRQE